MCIRDRISLLPDPGSGNRLNVIRIPGMPASPKNSAYTDQRNAASTPIEIRVSIVAVAWRRFFQAARWKGSAPHTTTGAARVRESHCQLSNWMVGIIAIARGGSVRTVVMISRRRSSATGSGSAWSGCASSSACGGAGTAAVEPASTTALMSCSTVTGSVNVTLAVSIAKLTLAVTPSMRLSRFSIRSEHELRVIPPTTRSTEVSIVGLTGVVVTMPLRASGRCRWRTPRRRRGRGARSRPPDGRARRSPRDPDQLVAGLVDCGPHGLQAGLLLCDHVDLAALEVHHHAPHTGDPTNLGGNGADAVGAGHPGHRVGQPRTHCGLLSLGPCRQPGRRCKRRYGSTVRQRQGPASSGGNLQGLFMVPRAFFISQAADAAYFPPGRGAGRSASHPC